MIDAIRINPRRKRLKIRPPSKETEFETNPRYVMGALGWLIDHAMNNGMTKLRIGADLKTKEAWMKFCGPRWYRQPIWWDMVPPPADSYPTMLQICLSLAELEPHIPITGIIRASKGWKRVPLQLTIDQIDSIQIAWAEAYALDREKAEVEHPDEAKYWADLETDGANGEGPDKGIIR